MEDREWIDSEWDSLSRKIEELDKRINANIKRADNLLVDIEFLRLMIREEMV